MSPQLEALALIADMAGSPEKDLLINFVVNPCAVGCGQDDGCFYCQRNIDTLKEFVAFKKAAK